MSELPASVLFACTFNSIRSPMAEAILKSLHGRTIFVDSVGVRPGELDAMAVQVMDEIGIDLSRHRPKLFGDLEDGYFDLVISLSPEAQHNAVELTRDSSCELEFWHVMDPSEIEGSREQVIGAYRLVRDQIFQRIRARFPQDNVRIIL